MATINMKDDALHIKLGKFVLEEGSKVGVTAERFIRLGLDFDLFYLKSESFSAIKNAVAKEIKENGKREIEK